jgi:DNA-binding NarL/FixJ family response regulator
LGQHTDFQIVGEATDGIEALRKIELTRPDVVIIDLMMPNLNGLEVLPQVRRLSPGTRAIVFSMQSAKPYVMSALKAGAAGYILKETGPGEIVAAIHQVLQGDIYLSGRLADCVEASKPGIVDAPADSYETLTPREREILQMTAEGLSSANVGSKLAISPRTVEIHRRNLMRKLGIRNLRDLVRYAIQRGILPLD